MVVFCDAKKYIPFGPPSVKPGKKRTSRNGKVPRRLTTILLYKNMYDIARVNLAEKKNDFPFILPMELPLDLC